MTTLNYNKNTYYVGFDAYQGGELEGQMVVDYIKANIDKIDRNGDGVIGYVLAIGDVGHNDSSPVPAAAARPWAPPSRRTALSCPTPPAPTPTAPPPWSRTASSRSTARSTLS